ncbi:MAG: TRAP transporter substrate-binding protein DctP [Oscillospiraceae bacterium]
MKRTLSLILAFVLVTTMLCACGTGSTPTNSATNTSTASDTGTATGNSDKTTPTYTWRLGTQDADGIPLTDSAYRFAKDLEEATNGDIQITVYPSSQLGDYEQMFEEVTMGTLDMAWISGPASFDQMMDIQGIPYLVENWDQARELWGNRDGYIYSKFNDIMQNLGATLLGVTPGGFLGIGAQNLGNLDTIFDPTVKQGVLIRHPSMDVARMIVDSLGYNCVTIAYSDLYTALQTGVADGWYGGGAALNYTSFRDVIKYYADYRYLFEVFTMLMNQDLFESLPEEYQTLIMDLAVKEQTAAFDDFQAFEAEGYSQLDDYGIQVLYPTDEQMTYMAQYVRDTVYPQLNDLFGEDTMTAISDQVAGLAK